MISRHWRGVTRKSAAGRYLRHLRSETFPQLAKLRGYRGFEVHRKAVIDGEEFVVITFWDSLASIRAFSGRKPERAVVPEPARVLMVRYEKTARHYRVAERQPRSTNSTREKK